ncbi:thaumatin family protein [Actinoplanes sp. NPDC049548]|uniref:thaumatin family protein n=1 Tax=Actinoplanes sp. NPDC049548 TaxID=3155152 RepID=UPI00343C3ADE
MIPEPYAAASVRPRRPRRALMSLLAVLTVVAAGLTAAFGPGFTGGSSAYAAGEHTITFVNQSAEKVWVGSTVNADGSVNFAQLPILEPGASATIVIPENAAPGHWRGKFFARQRCSGEPGSTFHCEVGDCGNAADHCAINGEQDASLAEFNFDPADPWGAPWYDVSYVNAVSLPITITPTGAPAPPPGTQYCAEAGCVKPLLDACPASNLKRDGQGQPLLCVNPNRDAVTEYSEAVKKACPRAYSWSKDDATAGNQVMYNCKECTGFTVTFHGNGTAPQPAVPGDQRLAAPADVAENQLVSNWHGKCIDVPGGDYSDRVRLAAWDCWNGPMQRFQLAADGTIRIGGKCVDVADGATADMIAIQVFTCNGTPAQQWVLTEAGDLVNPQADKCVDIAAWNAANGAPLQLWTCNGMANQKWHRA